MIFIGKKKTATAGNPNLLGDPGFDTGTGWAAPTGWTISGGEAHFDGDAFVALLQNNVPITGGVEHEAFFDFTAITAQAGNYVLRVTELDGTDATTQHQINVAVPASPAQSSKLTFTPAADCTEIAWRLLPTDGAAVFSVDNAVLRET